MIIKTTINNQIEFIQSLNGGTTNRHEEGLQLELTAKSGGTLDSRPTDSTGSTQTQQQTK